MRTETLLDELRKRDVRLDADPATGSLRVEAPVGVVTQGLRTALVEHKPRLLTLIQQEQERCRLEEADRRGLVIRWAEQTGWVSLHDPTDGTWHEVRAEECLPGVVEAAKKATGRPHDADPGIESGL